MMTSGTDETIAESIKTPNITGSEVILRILWSKIFDARPVSREDNFFSLGGDSAKVVKLCSLYRLETGKILGVREVFRHPKLGELADYIDKKAPEAVVPSEV